MKKLLAVWMLVLAGSTFGQTATGDVVGTIIYKKDKTTLIGAKAVIEDNGKKFQAMSDVDGRFRIVSIPSGKYTMRITFQGDTLNNIPVDVPIEAYCNLGTIEFEQKVVDYKVVTVNAGMRLVMGELPIKELTAKDIAKSSIKFDMKSMVASMSTDVHMSEDGELMFRGARKGDMIYVLDGIKCNDVFNVPSCSISKMMVYTGGLPAKYGDTMGGAIVVETKSYFELLRNYQATHGE
jgi:hypothetical protein